jgi:hypothetical protein
MNKLTTVLITGLAAPLAFIALSSLPVTGTGCGSGGSKGSSTGGTTGNDGGGGTGNTFPLPSTSTGFVDDPTTGVIGAWFAYGDGVGSNAGVGDAGTDLNDSDCVKKGGFAPADCSQITTPIPGMTFPPTDAASSQQCTSGIAAQVMPKGGNPDYTDLWGAGIGLDFANPGGDAGPAAYYDASAYSGIEFDFSADVLPVGAMRVNFPFMGEHGTDSPYWGGATAMASNLTGTTQSPQHVVIKWADIGGPFYLTQQTPAVDVTKYPFNPAAVQAIQFQVFTNAKATTPYNFCVANLTLFK